MTINYTDDIKIISSAHQQSKAYRKIESRLSHGFVFRIKGSVRYSFNEKEVTVKSGEFIFLPKGTSYEYTVDDSMNSLYTSINFQATLKDPCIRIYSTDSFHGAAHIAQSFTELWNFGSESDKYKCLSLFYDLLSHILTLENLDNEGKRKYSLIEPAVKHLKFRIFEGDLKINKLHRLCGISDTYFRKIFNVRFGMSPQAYVLNERLSYAKSIIESGDYDSIREVSESVGYNDPLYFSKAFKKFYGLSPTAYEKTIANE